MKDDADKLLDKVRRSNASAFTIVETAIDNIIALAERGHLEKEDWTDLALNLSCAKGRMAPLFNISNLIFLNLDNSNFNESILRTMRSIQKERNNSLQTIADRFVETYRPKKVMVNSYSATVLSCLTLLSKKVDLSVTVAESLPMGEGEMFAETLAQHGIDSEIIHDSMVFEWMKKVEMYLSGADAVLPDKVYNKMGSRSIAVAAKIEGKKTVVVSDSLKLCPLEVGDRTLRETPIMPKLKRSSELFESFDVKAVESFITEKGVFTSDDLYQQFRSFRISPLLKNK